MSATMHDVEQCEGCGQDVVLRRARRDGCVLCPTCRSKSTNAAATAAAIRAEERIGVFYGTRICSDCNNTGRQTGDHATCGKPCFCPLGGPFREQKS